MSRRLRPVSRLVTFGPALALPAWGWAQLRDPWHWAGLGIMMALGLLIIPAVIVLAVFLVPRSGPALVPRRWRKRYRSWLIGRGISRDQQRSSRIPAFLRRVTFAADGYRCVHCRLSGDLQVDHVRAWSLGGLTSLFNLMTLCGRCNRVKSNYWRARDGYIFYKPMPGADNEQLAAAILADERKHRYSLFRLVRAAWALGA